MRTCVSARKRDRDDPVISGSEFKKGDKPTHKKAKLEGEKSGQPEHFKVGSKERKRMREEGATKAPAAVGAAGGPTHTTAPKNR